MSDRKFARYSDVVTRNLAVEYERSVHRFAETICASGAKVHFNHHVRDVQTGQMRQVDAWIEFALGSHFPAAALVSCKRLSRKATVGHIESLIAEKASTGAAMAIMYSFSGFSRAALAKARLNGIQCCVLAEGKWSQVPHLFPFRSLLCYETFSIRVSGPGLRSWDGQQFCSIWDKPIPHEPTGTKFGDAILELALAAQAESNRQTAPGVQVRAVATATKTLAFETDGPALWEISVTVSWKYYTHSADQLRVRGSFNVSTAKLLADIDIPFHAGPLTAMPPDYKETAPEEVAAKPGAAFVGVFRNTLTQSILQAGVGSKTIAVQPIR